jgi:hypothetical protein
MFNLRESLKKTFLQNPATQEPLSISSEEQFVEKTLGDADLEFPVNYKMSAGKLTERQKQTFEDREDHYIRQYRMLETMPEVASAIDEIVNEVMNVGVDGTIEPELTFEQDSKIGDTTKKSIIEEWKNILSILDFKDSGDDLFRKWYVDGKLITEIVYGDKTIKEGIKNILQLTPFNFRKRQDKDKKTFYVYKTNNSGNIQKHNSVDYYDPEQIVISTSGLTNNHTNIGYLFYAIKVANNMSMIEDSFIIYRMLRAVETRIWNVNVGKMPKAKAETYLNKVIGQIKSELSYNGATGEFEGRTQMASLINDYVFPTRGNTEATAVNTIGGNTNFVDNDTDHQLFLKKLYIALKLPVNRLDGANSTIDFSSTDILRGELKFTKFTNKLRRKFAQFLLDILKLQLISKGLMTESEWKVIKSSIIVMWNSQNEIIENAKIDSFKKKSEALAELKANGILGVFISYQTAMSQILGMTKEQFEEEKKLIEEEKKDGYFYHHEEE